MHRFIAVKDVIVPQHRQRKTFDETAHRELVESVQATGLLHSIVLREVEGQHVLVAGERRLRAFADLYAFGVIVKFDSTPIPPGYIPYTLLADLSPLEAAEAEWEENMRRVNLSWQEQAASTGRLMELRTQRAEQEGLPAPRPVDIAEELARPNDGSSHMPTQQEILLSRHLSDPDIGGAKSLKEAFKALKRKEQTRKSAELAQRVGTTFSASRHQVFQADCLSWMITATPDQFDVICTDPPYGMGADGFGDSGGHARGEHFYDDDEYTARLLLKHLPEAFFRLSKPQAHLYMFCDLLWYSTWVEAYMRAGWRVFRTPLLWYKPSAYRAPWPEHGPQRKYECILYAVKGDRKTLRLAGDVIECSPDENLGHPAQKPVAVYRDLLSRSANPGDVIFDPFAGTGPILPAGHELKCQVVAVEQDAAAYGVMCQRLRGL